MDETNSNIPFFQNELTKSTRIIHTPSAFARTSLIHLQEVGSLTAIAPHVSQRESLRSYLFFIVTGGSGELVYNGVTYKVKENDCVFIDCRKPYRQFSSVDLWSLSWVHFYGPTMNEIYDKYSERGGKPVFRSSNFSQYQNHIQAIFDIAGSSSYTRDMQIAEKLTAVLALLMEDAWSSEKSPSGSGHKQLSVMEVKNYIDEHYGEKLSLDELSKIFFINKHYLARIFKERYGVTINGYIAQVRITKAKSLLRFSEKSIEEIGAEVGIPDPNYFARTFKRIEGMAPRDYRRQW